ncbi:MAG TPA: heme-binding domain-containing protein [Holophaga sp.]|nr:heme-binding domain-containing protein [Holophaga sp.]
MGKLRRFLRPKTLLIALGGAVILFGAIQFVPYGKDHGPQASPRPFKWASPAAESLARAACYDCHSNETKWWWAVEVAPFSWLAQSDIDEAKGRVNFSDWNGALTPVAFQKALQDGMPPIQYTLVHPEARLTGAMQETLAQGFQASLAAAQEAAKSAAAPPVPPAPMDAQAIIEARCVACHTAKPALRFHAKSADKANALLDDMVRKGASLSDEERKTLVAFYTR